MAVHYEVSKSSQDADYNDHPREPRDSVEESWPQLYIPSLDHQGRKSGIDPSELGELLGTKDKRDLCCSGMQFLLVRYGLLLNPRAVFYVL
jgi:hypothetical protein